MIGIKYVKSFIYKYKRFHVWFNKKTDEYYRKKGITNTVIVDMRPYDPKAVRKIQRECSDSWTILIRYIMTILIVVMTIIIFTYIKCQQNE